jgi:proteasome accessory factor A
MARLHVIFFDNTLCHVATLLKVGVMQIVLSMIEAGRVNLDLILDDPIAAVVGWSHDPTLQARAELTSGTRLTAVELQMRFLEDAQRFVAEGGCEGIVPRADEILAIWERTLTTFDRGEIATLAPQLDWVLKLSILRRAMEQRSNFTWESPQIKHLDHIFSSLDPAEGLYWAYERSGFVERIASEDEIAYFTEHPPENTRAWTRGTLLRRAGADAVEDVEWDWIRLRETGAKRWRYTRELSLASPLEWTRTMSQPVFEQSVDLDEILDGLDRLQADEDRERPERPAGQLKTVGWAGY